MLTDAQKEAIVDEFDDAAFERVVALVAEENFGIARRIIRANGVEDAEAVEVLIDEGIKCAEIDRFLATHRDYPRTDSAYARVSQHLEDHGLKWTAANLGRAWEDICLQDKRRADAAKKPDFDGLSNKEISGLISGACKLVTQEVSSRRKPSAQGIR